MDKLQFLDLTDLNTADEEQLNNILYNMDFLNVVEMPPRTLPAWSQHTATYEPEVNDGGHEQIVGQGDYPVATPHMMAPHTLQYSQMITQPSVYVNNVTANVSVHSFMPPGTPYPAVPFIQPPPDSSPRKARPSKSPSKRSPNYTAPFPPQTFPPPPALHFPAPGYFPYPMPHAITQSFPINTIFSPNAPQVYNSFSPVYTGPQHASLQQPPAAEPRDDSSVPYVEYHELATEEQPETVAEPVVEPVAEPDAENGSSQSEKEQLEEVEEKVAAPVVEKPVEEVRVDRALNTKAPPVTAFKASTAPLQKPPFSMRQKRESGPQFVEPPVNSGPPRKSYAQMTQSSDAAPAMKPLAMIHPTVHANESNSSPKPYKSEAANQKPPQNLPQTNYYTSNNKRIQPDKRITPDHDINLQRLGEFLSTYQLDHRPMALQPRGLTNRSNYCYVNAILQALVACPPFFNLMKSIPSSTRTPVIQSMVKFVNEFDVVPVRLGRREKAQATKDGATDVMPGTTFEPTYIYKMLSAMHAVFPVEGRQEDAEEFLSCLLNGLNDEMLEAIKIVEPQTNGGLTNGDVTPNGTPTINGDHLESEQDREWTEVINKSNKCVITRRAEFGRTPLSAIFRGQMRSRVFRTGVETSTTDNIQPFFTLQLDIEKASSVEKALELLSGRDEVQGSAVEEAMYTQSSLEELPLILLLHLKCFHYKLHTCSKIIKTVEFPIDLKIENKLIGKSKPGKDRQYKLLAVVYHDGKEATKGHYLTDVYHPVHSCWVRYDDATVRTITQQQVLNPKPPRMPYLLYYRRCDTIHPPMPHDKNR